MVTVRGRRWVGKVSPNVASRIGVVKVLAMPSKIQPSKKTGRLGARAQTSAAKPKPPKPARMVERREVRSEIVPEKNWHRPNVARYAGTMVERAARSTPKTLCKSGKKTGKLAPV
jgi:hypothetical protein